MIYGRAQDGPSKLNGRDESCLPVLVSFIEVTFSSRAADLGRMEPTFGRPISAASAHAKTERHEIPETSTINHLTWMNKPHHSARYLRAHHGVPQADDSHRWVSTHMSSISLIMLC